MNSKTVYSITFLQQLINLKTYLLLWKHHSPELQPKASIFASLSIPVRVQTPALRLSGYLSNQDSPRTLTRLKST